MNSDEKNVKVIIYVRVSPGRKSHVRLSVKAQLDRCRAYCLAKGWEVFNVIQDLGESAGDIYRPGLQKALNLLQLGKANMIVVLKLDRLTRSVKDLGYLLERMENERWSIAAVEESFDTSTANGRLALNILMSVSQWEREIVSERTRTVFAQKQKQQEYIGGEKPLGYDIIEIEENGKKVRKLKENPIEQEAIQIILSLRKEGKSLKQIAETLEAKELKTASGKSKWSLMAISRVCRRNGLAKPRKPRKDRGRKRTVKTG